MNVLDPSVDQSPWTGEEDARLEALVRQLGAGKWAQLADEFNAGRPLKRTDDRLRKYAVEPTLRLLFMFFLFRFSPSLIWFRQFGEQRC